MSGTLVTTDLSAASRVAAISLSALFLAPPTCTVPVSGRVRGPSDLTVNPSIDPDAKGSLALHPAARRPRTRRAPAQPILGPTGARCVARVAAWSISPASIPAPVTPDAPASAT